MQLTSRTVLATLGVTALLGGTAFAGVIKGTPGDDAALTGTAGDDRIRAGAGADTVDGLAGDDRIRGGRGDDTLRGGEGRDGIRAGRGRDRVDGGPGNDRIRTRDGERDVVDCGDGKRDRAVVDPLDAVTGCERVRIRTRRR